MRLSSCQDLAASSLGFKVLSYIGDHIGNYYMDIKGDARSLDYSSLSLLNVSVYRDSGKDNGKGLEFKV